MLEKEIERVGIPTVQICAIVPIAKMVGANRIVRAVAIPHPIGNPVLSKEEEEILRKKIVKQALQALETVVEDQLVIE